MAGPEGAPRRGSSIEPSVKSETVLAVIAVAAYLAAALWAKQLSLPGSVLIWFPPAGVAIGFLYFRPRLLPLLVAAEMFSTVAIMGLGHEFGIVPLTVNAVLIVGSYAVGAFSLRRLGLDPNLRTADDVLVLVFGCLVVGSALAAVSGVLVQVWIGLVSWDDVARNVGVFWVGDIVGAACLTPAILLIGSPTLEGRRPSFADDEHRESRWLLLVEYIVPSVVALWLMSLSDPGEPTRFVYLAFVPVVGLALRHGIPGAALSSAALGAVMTAGAHILLSDSLARSDFQILMAVLTLTGITTGAVVSSRRDLLAAKARVTDIIEATPDLVAMASADGVIRFLNPMGRTLLGVAPGELEGQLAFDYMPDDLASDLLREGMRSAERFGTWTGENRLSRADGVVLPVSQVLIAHRHDDDGAVSFSTVCRDMTDQRQLEDQLRRAALYDDATGLPNRALLIEQLARLVDAADHQGRSAVLFADVDHLKRINEAFGFNVGDQVVVLVASRILELVRGGDLVARYGGAQFVIVLPEVSDEFDAILFANRLLHCFAEPVEIEGRAVKVTGSVGIAMTDVGQAHQDALRRAEIALHRAKDAGGGRFALFDQTLELEAKRRMEIEADLREVLATGSWWLAYQPVVDASTRQVVGVEALLRWTHPSRGPVSPFDLIRLAEQSGSIVSLGREIFARACEEAATWTRAGFDLRVAINVSAHQLLEPDFVDDVRATLDRTGFDATRVSIELTETVLATDKPAAVETLRSLRELGCKIALDDFGTGYSSLSGLSDLPIDIVKIDRSFITDLTRSPRAAALVEAVVRLANALGLVVIAEGVEAEDQFDALVELGCHRIQGFVVSRPIGPAALTELLTSGEPGSLGARAHVATPS